MSRTFYGVERRRPDCLSLGATVRRVEADGLVELEFTQTPRCAGCAGTCTWSRPRASERARFRSVLALAPGDVVRVSVPANHLLLSAVLLHGLPLASLLGGALLGAAVGASDMATLIGAVAGLLVVFPVTGPLRRRLEALTLERAEVDR